MSDAENPEVEAEALAAAAAAAPALANPPLPGVDPAGEPIPPTDAVLDFIRRIDARMLADDARAAARVAELAVLQQRVLDQAAELALLRGPAPADAVPASPTAVPVAHDAGGPPSDGRRSHLSVHSTPAPPSFRVAPDVPTTRVLDMDNDDASSVISNVSRAEPTSKNYQNFLRSGEKTLLFSGSDTSDVNEWLVSVEELADTHGADYDEVLRGVQSLLTKSAKRFYREHLSVVRAANDNWDWFLAKSWFLRKFNPESRILRKVTEYHRCAQGRRSVNDYLDELLELRNYTSTGPGTDLEQRVRFLSGLRPDLQVEVRKHLAAFPGCNFDATVELTRNLADVLPKDHARDSVALRAIDAAQVRCYNCNEMGHFSNECPVEKTARSKAAQEAAAAKKHSDRRFDKDRRQGRVHAVKDAADKLAADKLAADKLTKDADKDKDRDDDKKSRG